MASSKAYLQFILEQLSELDEVTYRAMMGEFIIYYRGKIIGGIYDDRLLVKPVRSAIAYMPEVTYERPMKGPKKCCWCRMSIIKNFWKGYFVPCMKSCRCPRRERKGDL